MEREPIKVTKCDWNPPGWEYVATYGDYDLGSTVGYGATEADAIADLKQYEDD